MKSIFFILTFILFFLSSCSTVATIITDDVKLSNLKQTNSDSIKVFSKKDFGKSFKIIGQVVACADAGEKASVSVDLLKEQAALLGADAIFDLNLSITMGYWSNGIKATGTAIKYE